MKKLADFPVEITLPVQWGDQDAFGHVNNVVFFRWFESARIAYFDETGLSVLMKDHEIGPILAAINCNYLRQLKFPDTISVGAKIVKLGRSSMAMDHTLFSHAQDAMVAQGSSTVVAFNYQTQCSTPLPQQVRHAIEKLEGTSFSS